MREIKFRAWDKKKNIMWRSIGFRDSDCGRIYLPELGMMNFEDKDEPWIEGICDHERFELMQFTGLKDKNGKDIYEGDIVRWSTSFNKPDAIMEVKFEKDILGGRYTTTPFINDTTEVIGNIYENPELLKETK